MLIIRPRPQPPPPPLYSPTLTSRSMGDSGRVDSYDGSPDLVGSTPSSSTPPLSLPLPCIQSPRVFLRLSSIKRRSHHSVGSPSQPAPNADRIHAYLPTSSPRIHSLRSIHPNPLLDLKLAISFVFFHHIILSIDLLSSFFFSLPPRIFIIFRNECRAT